MTAWARPACVAVLLLLFLSLAAPAHARQPSLASLTPEETLIAANQSDAALCRDFSPLLKRLRVAWQLLDEAVLPAPAHDKHLLLIGTLQSDASGPLIQEALKNLRNKPISSDPQPTSPQPEK